MASAAMRPRHIVAIAVGGVFLSLLYYWLVAVLVGYSEALPIPAWWARLDAVIGRGAVALAWLEAMNTLGTIVAALVVAISAIFVMRQGALLGVTIAAMTAAAFSIGETAGLLAGAGIHEVHPVVFWADTIKLGLLPPALLLVLRRCSFDFPSSGRAMHEVSRKPL